MAVSYMKAILCLQKTQTLEECYLICSAQCQIVLIIKGQELLFNRREMEEGRRKLMTVGHIDKKGGERSTGERT
jgi:hypothetical protein